MARNPLLPFVQRVRDEVAKTGLVTAKGIRDYVRRDVDTYEEVLAAQNPKLVARSYLSLTIRTALAQWPAYRDDEGRLVHVDPDDAQPSWIWDRIRALRVEHRDDVDRSIAEATRNRDVALLREQMEEAPVEALVEENAP